MSEQDNTAPHRVSPRVRDATAADLPTLARIAEGTGMFLGDELGAFVAMMDAHLNADARGNTHLIVSLSDTAEDAPVDGAAYFAPEVMAQGVMNLLFIGVSTGARRNGHGHTLLTAFETTARRENARLAIIETASDTLFAPAWALYRQAGYDEEARVRDYYDAGLHKLIFRKALLET